MDGKTDRPTTMDVAHPISSPDCKYFLSYRNTTNLYCFFAFALFRAFPASPEKQPRMYYEDINMADKMTFVIIKYM